jgi:hypothetical protein
MRLLVAAAAMLMLSVGVALVMNLEPSQADAGLSATGSPNVFRHVVLFKFKDGTTPEQIQQVVDAFRALPGKIDAIQGFEWGTDASTEMKAAGFTHCFFVTFRDEKGRDAYLPHPAHKEFGTIVRPVLDKVLVFDYWSKS